MRIDIASEDARRADDEPDYEFQVFQLPNATGDGTEDYAAVRPSEETLLQVTQDMYLLQENANHAPDILNRILIRVFNPDDLRAALIESGDYDDVLDDGDGTLSLEGLKLATTLQRLSYRRTVNPKRDPLGSATLGQVAVEMITRWSGKDQSGKPQDYLPPSKRTGDSSRRGATSKAPATRSRSSAKSGSRDS